MGRHGKSNYKKSNPFWVHLQIGLRIMESLNVGKICDPSYNCGLGMGVKGPIMGTKDQPPCLCVVINDNFGAIKASHPLGICA
jgi:hypothetical protein